LAKLDAATYERIRQAEAKKLNVRGGFLDKEVAKARGKPPDAQQGHALHLPMPEPWPEPIDGAALLVDLAAFFTKYAFLPHRASIALALWTAHTYTFEVFRHSPRLHIKAIAKNSGKTTVLDLLEKVVCRALPTAHATSAVLFRAIEMATPTLLIDEADTFVHGNEEVRGVLNAGHKRGGQVLRAVGDDFEPRAFRVFSPVAIAGIGGLPGTIADRCIAISMKRAMQHELPSPIRTEAEAEAIRLSRCTVRWVADHKTAIAEAEPDMGELFNRIADNWRPLYVIADIAGDNWPELVRTAAIELTVKDDDDETTGVKLLADIKAVLTQAEMDPFNEAYVTSKNLLERLTEMEDRPWAEFGRTGKAITTSRLARLLKPFLIIPEKVGPKDARVNGYPIRKFIEPFKRYLTDNAKPN
jgi:hypothetical protein